MPRQAEDKLAEDSYAVRISAFRISESSSHLVPATRFFPQTRGVQPDGSSIIWRYKCRTPRAMPRPLEVKVLEHALEIQVTLYPQHLSAEAEHLLPDAPDRSFAFSYLNNRWKYNSLMRRSASRK